MAKRTRSCWPNLPMGGSTCHAFSLAPWKRTTIRRWYFLRSNIHLCRWMWTGAWAGLRQSWRSTVSTCHVDLSTSFSPRWTRASYIYDHIIFRRTPTFWSKTKITSQIMWRTTRPTWTSWRSQLTLLRPTCAPGPILSFLRFFSAHVQVTISAITIITRWPVWRQGSNMMMASEVQQGVTLR